MVQKTFSLLPVSVPILLGACRVADGGDTNLVTKLLLAGFAVGVFVNVGFLIAGELRFRVLRRRGRRLGRGR
jgi:hypothetical protein